MTRWLDALSEWAVGLMEALGGPGAGLAIALENLFPPLPSEVILPLAGFTASRGGFTLTAAIAWTTAGSVAGALVLYGLGAWLGPVRFRAVAVWVPLVELADLDRASSWFADHGGRAVLFGRMVPIVRSLISIPAGTERMPVGRFVGLTAMGSLTWNTLLILAGYLLGQQWWRVELYAGVVSRGVLVLGVAAIVFLAVRRFRRRKDAS